MLIIIRKVNYKWTELYAMEGNMQMENLTKTYYYLDLIKINKVLKLNV